MYHEEPILKVAIIMKCGALAIRLFTLFLAIFNMREWARSSSALREACGLGFRSSAPRPTGAGSASLLTTVLLYPYTYTHPRDQPNNAYLYYY
jgi:hypothetical protein